MSVEQWAIYVFLLKVNIISVTKMCILGNQTMGFSFLGEFEMFLLNVCKVCLLSKKGGEERWQNYQNGISVWKYDDKSRVPVILDKHFIPAYTSSTAILYGRLNFGWNVANGNSRHCLWYYQSFAFFSSPLSLSPRLSLHPSLLERSSSSFWRDIVFERLVWAHLVRENHTLAG